MLSSMKEIAGEKENSDAGLEIVNKVIDEDLNDPLVIIKLVESKD